MKINIHEDRCILNLLSKDVINLLKVRNLIRNEQERIDFCGMVIRREEIDVFIPRNSSIRKNNDTKSICSLLMRAIHKFSLSRERFSLSDGDTEHIIGESLLNLAFRILTDYISHGVYSKRVYEIKKNSSKIDWNRTIKKSKIYPSFDSYIYLDSYGKRKKTFYNDPVTLIHVSIIREIYNFYGWIFFNFDPRTESSLSEFETPVNDIKMKLMILENELRHVYSDRETNLIKDMIDYLSEINGHPGQDCVIGINKFQTMWEHMIDACLEYKLDINNKLAKPCYKINGLYEVAKNKGGRTDTVLRDETGKKIAIVDAKYYGATNPNELPGWPDIIKQFFYAMALKDIYHNSIIYNYFIFPGNLQNIESIHLQDPVTKTLKDESYEPIICIFVDPILLMKAYSSGSKLKDLSNTLLHI
ncbi:LlaJI family restriction endonuclease [Pantoea stewartii]|uniref:LlaJI family restriction endonuclease n=1 Tax=Pantoea stewartii TaxID=66269 RepID=UPI0013900664|nr:LlaJI family restriction endonuclease [Pantoea stewartii]